MIFININCISNCKYQSNGKCTLRNLPKLNYLNISKQQNNCPYMDSFVEFQTEENKYVLK